MFRLIERASLEAHFASAAIAKTSPVLLGSHHAAFVSK